METNKVHLERNGNVGIIRLNRPESLNVFDFAALVELEAIVQELSQDTKQIRVVIVSGEGKAFSAGADLKERITLNEQQVLRNVYKIRDVFTAIESLPQPTIAAMNGHAFGGGFELALACDFRFATAGALMGLTEVSLGIIPGAGGTQRLTRLIGPARAKELILTARKISAEEALGLGMLNGCADDLQQLHSMCFGLAEEILRNAPLAVYQAKYAINGGIGVDLKTGLDIEAKAYETIIPTRDRKEALEAFRDKRKPAFLGE